MAATILFPLSRRIAEIRRIAKRAYDRGESVDLAGIHGQRLYVDLVQHYRMLLRKGLSLEQAGLEWSPFIRAVGKEIERLQHLYIAQTFGERDD